MRFGNFCSSTLSAMTDRAAPLQNFVRDRRMGPEGLRNGSADKRRLRDAQMACRAAIHNIHFRNPHLINVGTMVGEKPLRVWPGLGVLNVGAFVLPPLAAEILDRRDSQNAKKQDGAQRQQPK